MLRLSKKTEYALMAVKFMAMKDEGIYSTAKEISDKYEIPFELLAKVLQKLSKFNIVKSFQGVKGGYLLTRNPEDISLIEIIVAIEPNYNLTNCMNESSTIKECSHINCCAIRDPLIKVQREIDKVFQNTNISQII